MAFLAWRGFLFVVNMALYVLVRRPTSLSQSVLSPAVQQSYLPSLDLAPVPLFPKIKPEGIGPNKIHDLSKLILVDSNKTPGRDAGPEQSELSSPSDMPTPDPEAKRESKPNRARSVKLIWSLWIVPTGLQFPLGHVW